MPTDRLAILRLDGGTYASARATLHALYDKLSPGGGVILDDYFVFDDNTRGIDEFILRIDDYGGYWIKDGCSRMRGGIHRVHSGDRQPSGGT